MINNKIEDVKSEIWTEIEKEQGIHIQQFIYRLAKKNHEEMMQIQKQFNDLFKKYGVLSRKLFLLCNPESIQGIKNISNIISSNQDEEVLMALVVYRDRKHRDEIVKKVLSDGKYHSIIQHFRNLITPGSDYIVGDFEPLNLNFG
jgi:uncharacterized protein YbaA (DUF1428 family)